MPTNEYSRADFLRALLNQQKRNTALGGSLVNPSVDNGSDLENSAIIDTTISGKTPINGDVANYDVEKATNRAGHNGNVFTDSLDNIFGFVDEIAAKFGAGFVGAWEGILDLGATAIGALGDATGWYDSDPFTKWASQDIGTAASEYIKTYVNLNPWSWIRKMSDGTYSNPDYWNDMFEGGKDILGSALFLDNNLKDYREDSDKYYRYNDEALTDMGQVGEFLGGAAHSIGFMLPSIMTGGIAGGSTAAAQAISLGTMGVMAAGKGSEEALNDGANAGRALGYGLASGAVEVAGEIVVGKALKFVGLGTGKIMGVIGKGASSTTVKVGSKTFVKELGKTMFEEGMEEVFSAVLEPATKAIYKGSEAFKDTYTNPDWWFGTNGHFNESVLGQFTSGAFVGGLSGAVHTAPVYKKLGNTNYNTMQSFREVVELDSQMAKMERQQNFDRNNSKYQRLSTERAEAMSSFIENLNESMQKSSQSQNEYLLELLTNKGTLHKALTDSQVGDTDANTIVKNYLNDVANKYGTHERSLISSLHNRLQTQYGTDFNIEYVSDSDMVKLYGKQNVNAKTKGFFDSNSNKIVLNDSLLNTKGGTTLVHEYFAHGLSKSMSKGNVRIMFNDIIETDIGKQLAKELKNSDNYNFKNVSNSNIKFQEELLGQFLERSFEGKNVATQIHNIEKTFNPSKLDKFITNLIDAFNNTTKFKSNKVAKEYAKVLNQWLKYGDNNKNIISKTLRKIVYKDYNNIKLNSYEKSIKSKYSKLVSLLENQLGEQVHREVSNLTIQPEYSKELTKAEEREAKEFNNTTAALFDIGTEAMAYEEYFVGETDYQDAYLSKRYVNKLNRKAQDILEMLSDYYDGDSSVDFESYDFEKIKKLYEEFATDDFIEKMNEIIDQVNSSEYPQGNSPEYDHIQELVDYFESLQNDFDDIKLNYEKYTEENYIRRILESNRTGDAQSNFIGTESSSEWKSADVERISDISKRLLREEYESNGNSGKLDIIVDSTGREYLVGAYNYTYNNLQKLFKTLDPFSLQMLSADHTLEEFKKACFTITSADGLSTLTVLANGDIINVVNANPKSRGFVNKALLLAIDNGGIKMDCYNIPRSETNFFNLPEIYSKRGFAPVSATSYNADFINDAIRDRFTKTNNGEPIMFLKYTGHNEKLFESYEQLQAYIHDSGYVQEFSDWDVAETKRNNANPDTLHNQILEFKKDFNKNPFNVKEEQTTVNQLAENLTAETETENNSSSSKPSSSTKPTITFKSIKTTEDIVLNASDYIKSELGKSYEVHYPDNFDNLSSKAFTSINSVKLLDTQAKHLTNILLETEITKDGKIVGTLSELLSASDVVSLQMSVAEIIKSSPNTPARSKATLPFEKALDRAIRNVNNAKTINGRAHIWQNLRNTIHNQYKSYLDLTADSVAKGGYLPLLNIFNETHWNGKSSYKLGDLRNTIENALDLYNEESIKNNFGGLQYSPEIHDALLDLEASLPSRKTITDKAGNVSTRDVSLDATTIDNLIRLGRLVKRQINNQIIRDATEIRPSVRQTVLALERMSYSQSKGLTSRMFRSWKRGFAPAYTVIEEMLGANSTLANKVIYDMQDGLNKQKLYKGSYTDLLNKKLKELNLRKTFNNKTFTIDGRVMNADQVLSLYISLNVEANRMEIARNGFQYILPDSKGESKLSTKITVNDIGALQSEVNRVLPENYRKLGDFLLETMNGSIKSEYMKMFEDKFGKYVGRNEIGKVGDKSYWMLFRAYQKATNVEKSMTNPAGVFSHAKSRVDTQNAVLITGALSSFTSYIDSLSSEIYVKPVYRDIISILNTKTEKGVNGQTVSQLLAQKVGKKDFDYLMTTLGNVLGVNQKSSDVFSRVVSTFSVAKLSLNVGSVLKQYGAAWTSNIPINKSTKALFSRLFGNSNVRAEYNQLLEEIGGLKYRESSKTILKANADAPYYLPDKIADFGMWGMSKADMFTTSTGVIGLMYIAQDQMGLKIGTNENKQWVKEHWAEFELSQPSGSVLSQNAVSRGDFGAITKAIFGFMQGDNRAALGSIIHKLGLYSRNRNVNISELRSQYKNAQVEFDNASANYNSDTMNETFREEYINAKTNLEDLRMKIKDYESFEIAGGKKIKLNIASGLLVQAVFISLVNELLKHLKGKEDWDEWEFIDNKLWILNVVKEGTIDWLPLINVFSNALVGDLSLDKDGNFEWSDGYGVQVPVVEVANNLVDTFTYFKNGNYKSGLTNLVSLAGDMTGLPFTTVRSYAYGIIKNFDPIIAEKVKNIFYNSTDKATLKTLETYADKGDFNTSKSLIKHIIENFRSGYVSERVNTELTNLYINGYNALPKVAMTSYTNDNGVEVSLSSQQIANFKALYSQADSSVLKLLQSSEYQSLTQEEKAKLIKKVYDAYYDYAKVKVVGGSASSKIAQILAMTNGNINLGIIVAILNKVSQIKENSRKTRKELVIEYINKQTSLSKQEKIFAMYLAGYSVSGNSQTQLVSYLTSKGASKSDVISMIGN